MFNVPRQLLPDTITVRDTTYTGTGETYTGERQLKARVSLKARFLANYRGDHAPGNYILNSYEIVTNEPITVGSQVVVDGEVLEAKQVKLLRYNRRRFCYETVAW